MPELAHGVQVHSITFGDRIEISYIEESDVSPAGMMVKTIVVNAEVVRPEVDDLVDSALTLVDAFLEAHRNPPATIRDRR